MLFSEILNQEKAKKFLKQVMAMERIPHAYLFTGISGIGKTSTARAMIMALNCREPINFDGCGHCSTCRQILGGNSPDFLSIRPDGQHIKIEQIRDDLNRKLKFAPLGKYRVCVIHQAETMTIEAANSFLKSLEEPPPGNIIILNATEPRDLLPTIVSRCQRVSFQPLPIKVIANWLVKNKDVEKETADVVAMVSCGSLGRALKMCESDFLEKRLEWLLELINLPVLSNEKVFEFAIKFADKARKMSFEVSDSQDAGIMDALAVWETWYRDLLFIRANAPTVLLINRDFSNKLKKTAERYTIDNLINSILAVDQTRRDLRRGQNIPIVMEHFILRLKRLVG